MTKSLSYLQQLLYTRFALFFSQECEYKSIYDPPQPKSGWIENLVQRSTVSTEERVILLLALAPHLFPQSLDIFLVQNSELNRPYTEFGGCELPGYRGFLPTGETAAFVLAGTDPYKRLEVMRLFDKNHWFSTDGILDLVREFPQYPLLSGRLCISEKIAHRLLEQETNRTEHTVREALPETLPADLPAVQAANDPEQTLDIAQAQQYPCNACSALCCRILHLESFPLRHYRDLDKIRYYLNFPNIEVLLSGENKVTVYFSGFCGFLERDTITCRIHNQPEQPNLCVHYSPYKCFYKKADADKRHIAHGKLWLNRERLDLLETTLRFSTVQDITAIPPVSQLTPLLDSIAYTECHESRPVQGAAQPATLKAPCADCGSLCCSTLIFPGKQPETMRDLDFIRYALGYPEVEYLVTRNDWIMKVNVRCKHLDSNNRCSVYELPERPLHCRYLNPHKCTIKPSVHQDKISIGLDQFNLINDRLHMDSNGNLTRFPSLHEVRKIVAKAGKF